MTRRRWIADEVSGSRAALTGRHAEHLARVLRVCVGQEFDIAAEDKVWRGRVTAVSGERVEFELGEQVAALLPSSVTLALAVFKFDRMEWAIEKCTELGVSRIVPVIAQRTDAHLADASRKRVERWRRVALQASEQSRRVVAPEIAAPVDIAAAVQFEASQRIVLSESERHHLLRDCLELAPENASTILAIGPEGGWTEPELSLFQQKGWTSASLGPTILRSETAAIAATTLVLSALG